MYGGKKQSFKKKKGLKKISPKSEFVKKRSEFFANPPKDTMPNPRLSNEAKNLFKRKSVK